jgi:hypothetical protein
MFTPEKGPTVLKNESRPDGRELLIIPSRQVGRHLIYSVGWLRN